ncbi:MAG: HD domain-containing protein [Candidatus Aenigmarchaeota archaeon]|nr:HD domain-containing protein [Candidatus Aenigmarchaeota archaeon]MDI6722729.1 HD domain-containing protein [Candidatus Aenigmarchaeota archaeon]
MDLRKITDFLLEIEKLKHVERRIYVSGYKRRETTPEHVWHMCMYVLLLEKKSSLKADLLKCLKMILIHDLVEVYAGDASIWDSEATEGKKEREEQAATKLFGMLPDNLKNEFMELWLEFEECKTNEANLAKTIDGLQALGQQISSGGKVWKEQNVTEKMIKEKARGYMKDESLNIIWEEFLKRAGEEGMFARERSL